MRTLPVALSLLLVLPVGALAHLALPSPGGAPSPTLATTENPAADATKRLAFLDPTAQAPEASAVIRSIAGPIPQPLRAAPTSQQLILQCPGVNNVPAVNNQANTFTFRATCPYRIVDDEDLMGSPQIAVWEQDPRSMAFLSLHGCSSDQGPTPRSRQASCGTLQGDTFTTFTSIDQGVSWFDNPWGQEGFGEHVATVMDREGHVYIAALWAQKVSDTKFDYHFKLYKGDEVDPSFGSSYGYAMPVEARPDANGTRTHGVIEEVNLVLVKGHETILPANATNNQTGQPKPGDVGNYTIPQPKTIHDEDRVAAVWFERAGDGVSPTGMTGWIDAAWTDTGPKNKWAPNRDRAPDQQQGPPGLAKEELIGPCMWASNPVAYDGKIYVACTVDAGYSARGRARIGEIDIWEIDPKTNTTSLVDYTGIDSGARPRMAGRDDGYMALMADKMEGDVPHIDVAYGFYGRHWEDSGNFGGDFGPGIHQALGNHPVLDARITAMALGQENTLFFSYIERANLTGVDPSTSPPPAAPPDPSQAPGADDVPVEYRKLLATTNHCTGTIVSGLDLNIGKPRHPFAEESVGSSTGAFWDSQDGMALIQRQDNENLEEIYFAYGDFGAIGYGIIDAKSGGFNCNVQFPAPFIPPAPLPLAVGTASAMSSVVGLSVGAVAVAMVAYLLAVKRKLPIFTAAEDK